MLHGPGLAGMFRHLEVQQPASQVREHDEYKENTETGGGHREKVDGCHLFRVVCQEGSLGLRRRLAQPPHIYLATVEGATWIPNLSSSP